MPRRNPLRHPHLRRRCGVPWIDLIDGAGQISRGPNTERGGVPHTRIRPVAPSGIRLPHYPLPDSHAASAGNSRPITRAGKSPTGPPARFIRAVCRMAEKTPADDSGAHSRAIVNCGRDGATLPGIRFQLPIISRPFHRGVWIGSVPGSQTPISASAITNPPAP